MELFKDPGAANELKGQGRREVRGCPTLRNRGWGTRMKMISVIFVQERACQGPSAAQSGRENRAEEKTGCLGRDGRKSRRGRSCAAPLRNPRQIDSDKTRWLGR